MLVSLENANLLKAKQAVYGGLWFCILNQKANFLKSISWHRDFLLHYIICALPWDTAVLGHSFAPNEIVIQPSPCFALRLFRLKDMKLYFFHVNVETLLCQSAAFHYGPSLMSHSLSISGSHLSGPLLLTNLNPAHIQSKLQELHATKWFSESCNSIVDMFLPRRKSERAWNHEVPVGSVGFSVLARCCRCLAFGAELCCEAPHLTTLQRTAMTRRSWVCGSQSHAKTVLNMSEGSVVHYFCACSSAEIVLTQVYSGTGWLDRVFASANSRGLPSNSIWTHLNRFKFSRI